MLRSFSLKNFHSFRESVQVSLELNGHTPDDERSFSTPSGLRLSKVLAAVGANGSGKTTLIKALTFLNWFAKQSFHAKPDEPIPLEPHFLTPDAVSEFEMEFELEGKLWRYRLAASKERVYSESLHVKQSRVFSYVFTREWIADQKAYAVKQQQFGLLQKEAEKVRENASLISTAAQYEVAIAQKLVATGFFSNVYGLGRRYLDNNQILGAAAFYADHPEIRSNMARLLSQWDLGLSDVRLEKQTVTRESGQTDELYVPFGIHRVGEVDHPLFFLHESSGTQGAFLLLSRILPALQSGGLVVIDELEADLHPHMLTPILDLFFSPRTNPHNAQVIFTSHAIEVLSLLHKSQVVLVEKDDQCQSDAWRLDSVKGVRVDDNLYAKYMAGAYGAIPKL